MKWLTVLLSLLLIAAAAPAQSTDDQYVRIHTLIQEGDTLSQAEQYGPALARYVEAQTLLQRFQKGSPDWNTDIIKFRLDYLARQIADLTPRVPAAGKPAAGARTNAPAASPGEPRKLLTPAEFELQLSLLNDQVRQLQSDKATLEAKLKEAFSAKPAALDPRELAKAEEKIRLLQKENDLLKVTLAKERPEQPGADNAQALKEAQKALEEANQKLARQTEQANALALEKKAMQEKLASLQSKTAAPETTDAAKASLDKANSQLAEYQEMAVKLRSEREALQTRVQTLTRDAEALAAIRAENERLKSQAAKAQPATPSADANKQLAEASAQVASLQSDRDILRLEKTALERRVQQMSATNQFVIEPFGGPGESKRIRQLERERDSLQKQLDSAKKQLASRKSSGGSSRVLDLENQVSTLQARLETLEAKRLPYTPEELALFKSPQPVAAEVKATPRAVKELPPGTAVLIADAHRYFATRQYDKAEEAYQQVLRRDDKNVTTLANLASIQVELKRYDEAEKNVRKALELAPDDVFSLTVLGQMKFTQGKNDEALDALSRAAKLAPDNAGVQNLLGLTLSEKGLRGPAETALRRAIQIDPRFGDAHRNLAVIYLNQQPPLVELARWHYQKAIAAGSASNAKIEKMLEEKSKAAPR